MKNIIKTKNKKALSEIISYVLLIVISLSLASGIYIWLKANVPADKETCSEEISLSIKNYTCDANNDRITLTIENKGFFSVAGFFIRGSNQTTNLPVVLLSQVQDSLVAKPGRYDFQANGKLLPATFESITFKYDNTAPLKRIQIQPYTIGEKTKTLLLCDKGIISQEIIGCD